MNMDKIKKYRISNLNHTMQIENCTTQIEKYK